MMIWLALNQSHGGINQYKQKMFPKGRRLAQFKSHQRKHSGRKLFKSNVLQIKTHSRYPQPDLALIEVLMSSQNTIQASSLDQTVQNQTIRLEWGKNTSN